MNMRAFAEAYPFLQLATAAFQGELIGKHETRQTQSISQLSTGQLKGALALAS
jgi:hypothetical protein